MDFTTIFRMFATPIGGMVNKGIGLASASAMTWMVAKGVPAMDATQIVSGLALAVSAAISVVAHTQGVQIDRINNDAQNGVTVVNAAAAAAKGVQPVNGPLH